LTITGGTDAVLGTGTTIQVKQAGSSQNGFLSSTDWTTFNSKQNTITNPVTGTGASGQVAFWNGTSSQTGDARLTRSNSSVNIGVNANNGFADNAVLSIIGSTDNVLFPVSHARSATINLTSHNQSGAGTGTAFTSVIQNNTTGNLLFITNSITKLFISRSNDRVGILNVAPSYTLDVTGTFRNSTGAVLASNSGNVQIGTTTDAGFRLDVNGTARVTGAITGTSTLTLGQTGTAGEVILNRSSNGAVVGGIRADSNGAEIGGSGYSSKILVSNGGARIQFFTTTERMRLEGGNLLIGTTSDVASSKLTIESTTQGVLFPRMTTTQKIAIASPATGLVVYDTTLNKLCVRGALTWETITSL
jgi:hypothetical protein